MTTATDRYSPARLALSLLALLVLGIGGADAGETAGRPRLVYAEPLAAGWSAVQHAAGNELRDSNRSTLRFNAFGRSFDLALTSNDRLGPPRPGYSLHKGAVASVPGSWARVTRHGRLLTGLVFDGREYFGIEPVANLREFLDPEVPVPAGDNLVYRLSDLLIEPGALACGLETSSGPVTAAAAVTALAAELTSPEMATAIGPTRRVRLAPVADVEFSSLYGNNADAEILARLNIIDGIFTEQVGVDVDAEEATMFTSTAPPYSLTSTTAKTLLDQLSDYRLETREQAGITHLFTGKQLQNNLVGIAWQDSVCLARQGAGLSTSANLPTTISAYIAAHEVGHNLGAPHDGDSKDACGSTSPTSFLMAPQVSGSQYFSPCSLAQIQQLIEDVAPDYPNCLTRLYDFDVTVSAPASRSVAPGTDLPLAVTVRNDGTQATDGVLWQLVTPPELSVVSVTPEYGACTTATSRADCNIGTLPGESSWQVTVVLRSDVERIYNVTTSVSAPNDEQANNNSARISVTVGELDSGGSGGGGAPDPATILGLSFAAVVRRALRRRNTV